MSLKMEKKEEELPPKPYSKGWLGAFQQQRFKNTYILYTPIYTAVVLLIVALVLIPIGIVVIVYGTRSKTIDHRYDNINNYSFQVTESEKYPHTFNFNGSVYSMGTTTYLSFHLKETLAAPVLMMYSLERFKQNYRNFVMSRDAKQVYGKKGKITSDCKPFKTPGEYHGVSGVSGYYSPCGTIAWSVFNDSFSLYKLSSGEFDGQTIPTDAKLICNGANFDKNGNSLLDSNQCSKKGIALSSSTFSFKDPATETSNSGPIWMAGGNSSSDDPYLKEGYYYLEPGHKIPYTVDEDFVVWSGLAMLPKFSNIYRIINTDLEAGDYLFDITELYNFPGEKHIILATRNWLGTDHRILGCLTVTLGVIAFVSSMIIMLLRYPFATQ